MYKNCLYKDVFTDNKLSHYPKNKKHHLKVMPCYRL